jgi:hypothetical protein
MVESRTQGYRSLGGRISSSANETSSKSKPKIPINDAQQGQRQAGQSKVLLAGRALVTCIYHCPFHYTWWSATLPEIGDVISGPSLLGYFAPISTLNPRNTLQGSCIEFEKN